MTAVDVLTVGETMALVASTAGPLRSDSELRLRAAGAESNVAATLALAGFRSCWVSRIGDDPIGDAVLDALTSYGIDTSHVIRDAHRPTGVFFKNATAAGTTVHYYRAGSAASTMHRDLLANWARQVEARLVHVTGITAALSESAREVVQAVVAERAFGGATVSFDVNHRPALKAENAADRLLHLARQSDIVFVGLDEAGALWDVHEPRAVRRLLPEPRHVVVKDGAAPAWCFTGDELVTAPVSPGAEVVDVVGAGDAFAAGWIGAHLQGADELTKLRMGHWTARRVIASTADVALLTRADWDSTIAILKRSARPSAEPAAHDDVLGFA